MRRSSAQSKPTPVATLIQNLRLLDLDEEFDYPPLTLSTFANTSPSAEQTDRVRAALWILYRLLSHLDRSWASGSVAECFPPLEAAQQAELKLQIYRRLGDFKREGELPRELQVRRTMLDECKGPKFEELLACLSSLAICRHGGHTSSTSNCTEKDLESSNSKGDGSIVSQLCGGAFALPPDWKMPMSLAYRSSLSSTLKQRNSREQRILTLRRALHAQREGINKREQDLDTVTSQRINDKRVSQRTLDRLERTMRSNWSGDKRWVDIVLRGTDSSVPKTAFLERPFTEIWQLALDNKLYKVGRTDGTAQQGLLASLENRVAEQNARLKRWRRERDRLIVQAEAMTADTPMTQGTGGDETHGMQDKEEATEKTTESPSPVPSKTRKSVGSGHSKTTQQRRKSSIVDKASKQSCSESKPSRANAEPQPALLDDSATILGDEQASPAPSDPTAALASQIVSSVLQAAPTPARAPASTLAERTRLSMAQLSPTKRMLPLSTVSEQERTESSPHPFRPQDLSGSPPKTPDHFATLAERTRQSMSMASTAAKPRHLRRTSRTSRVSNIYPVNQFETPRRDLSAIVQIVAEEEKLDERLEEFSIDEEAAFKSRPRVAATPPPSDAVEEHEQYEGGSGHG